MDRRIVLLVTLAACGGGSTTTAAKPTTQYLGSYEGQIGASGTSHDYDLDATVQALQETGQTLYGFPCDDGTAGDNGTGFYWQRLIADSVDGILAPFTMKDEFYESSFLQALLRSTKTSPGAGDLVAVQYGMPWGVAIQPDVVDERVELAAWIADAILVRNLLLALARPAGGIFAERASTNGSYDVMAFWPMNQKGLEGWYPPWTAQTPLTGIVTPNVLDNYTAGGTTPYFRKTVSSLETGTVYYDDATTGDEGAESLTTDLGTTPTTLVVRVETTAGVGNFRMSAWFRVSGVAAWTYASGTTVAAIAKPNPKLR